MNNMNVQMAQLLAQLNQKPQVAATFAAAGAHNDPALGPLAGQVAPAAGQVATGEPESDNDGDAKDQILLDSLMAIKKNQAKKEMLILIKDGVKHGLWRHIKIIKNLEVRRQAALCLLADILCFKSMQGDSIEAAHAQEGWLGIYETHVNRSVNEHWGYIQQHLKMLVQDWCRKHGNTTACPPWSCFWPLSGVILQFSPGLPRPLPQTGMRPSSGGSPKFCPLLLAISATGKPSTVGS